MPPFDPLYGSKLGGYSASYLKNKSDSRCIGTSASSPIGPSHEVDCVYLELAAGKKTEEF